MSIKYFRGYQNRISHLFFVWDWLEVRHLDGYQWGIQITSRKSVWVRAVLLCTGFRWAVLGESWRRFLKIRIVRSYHVLADCIHAFLANWIVGKRNYHVALCRRITTQPGRKSRTKDRERRNKKWLWENNICTDTAMYRTAADMMMLWVCSLCIVRRRIYASGMWVMSHTHTLATKVC